MCSPIIEKIGATPATMQWTVVRGDTSEIRVDFLENDEVTHFDTTDWTYLATAYDQSGNVLDNLPVTGYSGYAIITVPSSTTQNWGTQYKTVVAELPFDLEVTIPGSEVGDPSTIWTPVLGTICVLGDISKAGSL